MARTLNFIYEGTAFKAELIKVDRTQLYGSVRVLTQDSKSRRCEVASLASDGKTLIPRGGTALGYVNTLGEWISRDALQAVDLTGEPVEVVESSFDAPIELGASDCISPPEFLDHSVRLTYRLSSENELPDDFLKLMSEDGILKFGFSYRGGIGYDPAFLLTDEKQQLWMMIAEPSLVEFVGLEQAAQRSGETIVDEIDNDDDDNLDFGML